MSENLGVGASGIICGRFPAEYEQHIYQSVQEEAARELIKLLVDNTDKRFCVSLHTKINRIDFDQQEYRVVVDVSKVDEVVYYAPKIMSYEDMTWRKLSYSACYEITARIKRGVRKLFKVRK